MLTPEKVQELRTKYEITPKVNFSIPPKEERASAYSELKQSLTDRATKLSETFSNVTKPTPGEPSKVVQGVETGLKAVSAVANVGEQGAGATLDILGAGFKALGLDKLIEAGVTGLNKAGEAITPQIAVDAMQQYASSPKGQETLQMITDNFNNLDKLAKENPEVVDHLKGLVNLVLLAGGKKAEPVVSKVAADTVKAIPGAIETAGAEAGGALKTLGESVTGLAVPMEKPTTIAVQNYQASQPSLFSRVKNMMTGEKTPVSGMKKPTTEASTATRLLEPGTEWQLGVDAKRVSGELWEKAIRPSLKSIKEKADMRQFFTELGDEIIAGNADLARRKTLLNALESLKGDFNKVGQVSYEKLQDYKAGWAKFLPEKSFRGEPIAGALNEVRSLAADKARGMIHSKVGPDVSQAYIDYGNLQSIIEAGQKTADPLRSKTWSKQMWEEVVDKAVTPVATLGGKVLYKTGEGLEFVGEAGAKYVRDIIENPKAGMSTKDITSIPGYQEAAKLADEIGTVQGSKAMQEFIASNGEPKILEGMRKMVKDKPTKTTNYSSWGTREMISELNDRGINANSSWGNSELLNALNDSSKK